MLTPDYEDIARQLAGVVFDLLTSDDDEGPNRPPFREVFPDAAAMIPRTRLTGSSDGAPFGPVKTIAMPTPEGVYAIPGPPPTERTVTDSYGGTWRRTTAGIFVMIMADATLGANPDEIGRELVWPILICTYGPITLLALTDEEKEQAVLYGEPGQRWGDPYKACPYVATASPTDTWDNEPCRLGVGHTGPHKDQYGNPLGETTADGSTIDASVRLAKSVETACNCGHPDQHRPGCPRYAIVSGTGKADPFTDGLGE